LAESYDVAVLGGGTAGCVLAARLSEEPSRSVCLVEAGPDYGPRTDGRWPEDILDPRALAFSHDWGVRGEDRRSLGARIMGGCSSHNACMVMQGTPADYDEWGPEWNWTAFAPYLERAAQVLGTKASNTLDPGPFHQAFLEAALARGHAPLDRAGVLGPGAGVGPFPANVEVGIRRNTAFSYLDEARGRPNLTIRARTLVNRVRLVGSKATGALLADGSVLEAKTTVVAAGAYFSPAILMRSGIGPVAELRRHGIGPELDLPVGERLLDHCGTGLGFGGSTRLIEAMSEHEQAHGPLFEPHCILKAASSVCEEGTFDLHLMSWISPVATPDRYEPTMAAFLMKPRSMGRLRLDSSDPTALPAVERGFLTDEHDLVPLLEGIALGRELARTQPLAGLIGPELRPGGQQLEEYLRATVRNYFHPAGTCPIGTVVDARCAVLATEGRFVADASVMPTIPRANTNLTVVAIAERVADLLDSAPAA
jgi:choline dehydrogenase-like flavoprotein